MKNKNTDMASAGVVIGIILPMFIILGFLIYSSSRFESIAATYNYFQNSGLMYKIVSLSIMPSVALFFYWTRKEKVNQARGILLSSLFYGVFVFILYLS